MGIGQERRQCAPHLRALSEGCRGVENQTDPALREGIAKCRYSARYSDPPHRETSRRGNLEKVASFCNVDLDCVIQSEDLASIYEVPVNMQNQGLDTAILRKMGEPIGEKPALGPWKAFLDRRSKATEVVNIGLVGKYDLQDAYKSIRESLSHAGTYNDHKVKITFINSEYLTEENVAEQLKGQDGIVICPGFGQRGIEGKIIAAHYTRTHDIPTFGICLGMQMMVIEFARNVLGYKDANSREMDEKTPHNVIDIMEEQKTSPTWVEPCASVHTNVY